MPTTATISDTRSASRPARIDRTDWTFADFLEEGRAWALSTYPAGSSYTCNSYALERTAQEYALMCAPSAVVRKTLRAGFCS